MQGEASAVSAMPGAIARTYLIEHTENGITYHGQLQKQIKFLKNVPAIKVENGYIQLHQMQSQGLKVDVDAICVGLQREVQVTGGFGPRKNDLLKPKDYKAVPVTNPDQKITQVFTATANLDGLSEEQKVEWHPLAQTLLDAAYQGTLYAAALSPKKKVFLTLVGGGVFKNKLSWIIDAIKKALEPLMEQGGLDITLVIYYSGLYAKEEWHSAETALLERVRASGGTWTRYKKDGTYRVQ